MGLLPNLRVLATKFQGDIPDLLRFLGLLEKLFLDKHAFLRDYRTSVAELYSGFCQQPCSRSLQRSLSQPQGFVSWPVLLSQCSTVKPKLLPALFGSSLYAGREHKLCVLLETSGWPSSSTCCKVISTAPERVCSAETFKAHWISPATSSHCSEHNRMHQDPGQSLVREERLSSGGSSSTGTGGSDMSGKV